MVLAMVSSKKPRSKKKSARRQVKRARKSVLCARPATRRWTRSAKRKSAGFLKYTADAGVVVLSVGIVLAVGLVFLARDLPATDGLWRQERGPKISLVAADGTPMVVQGEVRGEPIRLADLPAHVPLAVLAVEDRNFYHHFGINPFSIIRAMVVNILNGEVRQGGSTLTQQLAKNLFLTNDRTYKRKLQELLLAFWLEYRFSKKELLTLYLNRVYFGAGAYGIDAASYRYFDKSARYLELNEAAILAGLLKAPTRYAPTHNPEDSGARAKIVIAAMVEAGFLDEVRARETVRDPVFLGPSSFSTAPYFVDYATIAARNASRHADQDIIVRTTFDRTLQIALEDGINAGIALAKLPAGIELAGVIVDNDGAIKAIIGGRNYSKSQFNRAAQAKRQPGSVFKPFVYLAGLEAGFEPHDRIDDTPITVNGWAPRNYGDKYYGNVTLNTGLARSLNGATIRLQEKVGRKNVRTLARRAGFTENMTAGPSLGLGVDVISPLKLAGAYAALSNGGYRVRLHAITSIDDPDGHYLYQNKASRIGTVASSRSISLLNEMLREVVNSGTGKAAALEGFPVAGKTGTTQNNRDAWFAGHVGGLTCIIWVGKDDNSPMNNITGGGAPAIIWREIMARSLIVQGRHFTSATAVDIDRVDADPLGQLIRSENF